MEFGICTHHEDADLAALQGWAYVEENVQVLLRPQTPDADWKEPASTRDGALPILVANCLLPATLKVVGPNVDLEELKLYLENACRRAAHIGLETLVFGSGGARQIPDGFPRETARRQILDFLRSSPEIFARHQITLAIEPLHRGECNILNSVGEALEYAEEIDSARVRVLADTFHFWQENENLKNLQRVAPFLAHVHVADAHTRAAPRESDYRAFFNVLRAANYRGKISVEAINFDIENSGARALTYIKAQWESA